MRYGLVIEYDGTRFHGWQKQPHACSVQQVVEQALSQIANADIAVVCAGRTDAGVHALAQVVHFDSDAQRDAEAWRRGCNALLPENVSVSWAGRVGDGFHARYSAAQRTYCYLLSQRLSRSALMTKRCWELTRDLDITAMRRAASRLLGEHDFSAFRSASCQAKTANRNLSQLEVDVYGETVRLTISANAFLQNMVRIITGVLVEIGHSGRDPDWIDELLQAGDRRVAGVTAPAEGLYLTAVRYLQPHQIPSDRTHLCQ